MQTRGSIPQRKPVPLGGSRRTGGPADDDSVRVAAQAATSSKATDRAEPLDPPPTPTIDTTSSILVQDAPLGAPTGAPLGVPSDPTGGATSAASPTSPRPEDAGVVDAYRATIAHLAIVLKDQGATIAHLQAQMQRQGDRLAALQGASDPKATLDGSVDPPIHGERAKGEAKSRRWWEDNIHRRAKAEPKARREAAQAGSSSLRAGLQALLDLEAEREAKGRTLERRHKTGRGCAKPAQPPPPPVPTPPSVSSSVPTSDSESSESSEQSSDDPTDPSGGGSPPSSSSAATDSSLDETIGHEAFDRRLAIKPANRRFKRLLSYKTYFLLDTSLAYPPKLVRKAHRLNKDMDGAFQGQPPFTGKDPLGVFTFLSTFKRACDASGITHGQALALLGFRLAGDAKRSFASAVATKGARDRYAIRTYGDGVNWLLKNRRRHLV
ncbi:hypothetical protein MMPV_003901 [Pyropia vietnamensis]